MTDSNRCTKADLTNTANRDALLRAIAQMQWQSSCPVGRWMMLREFSRTFSHSVWARGRQPFIVLPPLRPPSAISSPK